MRGELPAAFFSPRDAANEYDYLPHSRACLPSSRRRSPKRPLISLLVPADEIRTATSWFYIVSGRVEHTSGLVLSSFVRNWSLSMRLLSAVLIFGPRRGHPLSFSLFFSPLLGSRAVASLRLSQITREKTGPEYQSFLHVVVWRSRDKYQRICMILICFLGSNNYVK